MTTAYGSDVPSVKVENPMNDHTPHIKPDPDSTGASPAAHTDDDLYEDAGDLEFGGADKGLYLTRVPKFLWERWSQLDDNQEVTIGTVRVEGGPENLKRMSILLSPDVAQNRNLPREYNMHIIEQDPMNTFVFSEKDLPGYRAYSADRAPPRFKDRKRIEKTRKPDHNFRRAIPKQTALLGQVRTEINCLPVENKDYLDYMRRRAKEESESKPKIHVLNASVGGNTLQPGILGATVDTRAFITKAGPNRLKKQGNKAVRLPADVLLDQIMKCFERFDYWALRSLKAELNQPETYLKEVLERVATLTRSGMYVGTYQLQQSYKDTVNYNFSNVKSEPAPEVASDFGGSEDEDEEAKMVDVLRK
ncbi:transcription initiation factor IIF, beta subunit-domain-containing protein [Usnea florida]